jgi:hypothetical protein
MYLNFTRRRRKINPNIFYSLYGESCEVANNIFFLKKYAILINILVTFSRFLSKWNNPFNTNSLQKYRDIILPKTQSSKKLASFSIFYVCTVQPSTNCLPSHGPRKSFKQDFFADKNFQRIKQTWPTSRQIALNGLCRALDTFQVSSFSLG